MKKIEGSMPPAFENNYKPKEAIDWAEIEQLRRQHNPQSTSLNFLFGIFNIVNFITQNLLLSEWKKLIKDMSTTRRNYAIIREFSTGELRAETRDWSTFLMLKSQLENSITEGFKNEFQTDFYRLNLAMFNNDIDIAFSTLLSLVKAFNDRNPDQELINLCSPKNSK